MAGKGWLLAGAALTALAVAAVRRRRRLPVPGYWKASGHTEHRCMLPRDMPPGVHQGLIFRCSVCDAEWSWRH